MALEQLPDWTDIGRDIGRKVRDILNPRHGDNGPTTEDRRAERLRDVLKGFAYFDTIDEVLEWTVDQVDPLQQANIPLVIRDTTRTSNLKPISKARTILCHDYKGGYKDYESVRPATLHEQLWHCEHLQYVDTFIYFSHKLVCVPPPSWTNLLHRNGIKVLGTFLTEPQNPAVDRLLSVTNGRYVLADVLAAMSHTYGFDGWVLNFEKKFSSNMTDKIVEFIEQLKTALGIGYQVIWYDALDIENRVRYQNGLSRNNLPFAQAADALFTNYRWTEEKLRETKDLVLTQSMDPANICFGIDVWAQNTNMPGPPRITFPPNGGGGTNTGLAIRYLNEYGFSPVIFAPAWTHEHFSTSQVNADTRSIAQAVNSSFWDGVELPDYLGCDCKIGRPHHTSAYRTNSVIQHSSSFPCGSSTFFATNFTRAFGVLPPQNSQPCFFPTLGSQAIIPNLRPVDWPGDCPVDYRPPGGAKKVYGELKAVDGALFELPKTVLTMYTRTVLYEDASPQPVGIDPLATPEEIDSSSELERVLLFRLSMNAENLLRIQVSFTRAQEGKEQVVGLFAAILGIQHAWLEYYSLPYQNTTTSMNKSFIVGGKDYAKYYGARIVGIGFYCESTYNSTTPLELCSISSLSILPNTGEEAETFDFIITDLRIVERGSPPNRQKRLAWDWHGKQSSWPSGIPWSRITGPFEKFIISMNGCEIGFSHCLEFPLTEAELEGHAVFEVKGSCFGNVSLQRQNIVSIVHNS